jgi:redox-sensing transcriptional repressor
MFNRKSVTRLSRYRRALLRFKDLGYTRIISATLGEDVGVTASQVRKDFSTFGISGNKKGGYQIDSLLESLRNILGKNRIHNIILVGVGNIGTALLNYKGFEKEGIQIVAGFDIDRAKIQRANKIPVLPLEDMEEFVRENRITTGIISVPAISAQEVCNKMVSAGICGILNFSPRRLKVKKNVVITNVNILSKLESIFYFVDGFGQNA